MSTSVAVPSTSAVANLEHANCALNDAERALDSPDVDLIAAWQWAKDVQQLLKLRKAAAGLLIKAKRVEAKALRRIGQIDESVLNKSIRWTARYLAEMSDAEFEEFLASMYEATGTVLSDIRNHRREKIQEEWRSERREYARSGEAGEYRTPMSPRNAAKDLLEAVLQESETVSTTKAIDVLADNLMVDSSDQVVRQGLNALITRAASETGDKFGWTKWKREYGDPCPQHLADLGRIPHTVTFQDDEGTWIRSSWKHASMRQLLFNVQMIEDQAAERTKAAREMRALYEHLTAVINEEGLTDLDDTTRASDVLHLGRIHGRIQSTTDEVLPEARTRFPRWYALVLGHFGTQSVDKTAEDLAKYDILSEDDLTEEVAERIAPILFNGGNRVTMERFAHAYAPRLEGTFAVGPWERATLELSEEELQAAKEAIERL